MIVDGRSMAVGTAVVLGLGLLAAPACKSSATETSPLLGDPVPLGSGAALPALPLQTPWDPTLCPPVAERQASAAFSDFTFGGTCAFRHEGRAICKARGDDFYAIVRRKLEDGSSAELFINVEYYSGAGTYEKKTEILFIIQHGQSLYRWSNMQATMTLGMEGGGLSASDKLAYNAQGPTPLVAILPPTELEAEPGTKTSGKITLSGTLGCAPK